MSRLMSLLFALIVGGCTTIPQQPYDLTKPLKPCGAAVSAPVKGRWVLHLVRDGSADYAQGAYAARVRVWLTYSGDKTELKTIDVGPEDVDVPLQGREAIIVVDVDRCEAFEPIKA